MNIDTPDRVRAAATTADEQLRLAALYRYEVLDTAPEVAFDDIALLAAHICKAPIALVSFVDQHRQWFKSRIGIDSEQTARDVSFCTHTIRRPDDLLVVPDALADPRFSDNPLVAAGPCIRFYAGAPLVTPEGHALGALCVKDVVPRNLDAQQQQALRALSRQVVTLLELRRNVQERKRIEDLLRAKNEDLKTFAYTVSHDLKAPLRGISGYAQELERRHQDGLGERARFCIQQIITASHNLDQLIEDLLNYSRFVAEKPESNEVHLPDLIGRILRDRSLTLGEQGVQVDLQLPPLVLQTWECGLHQVLSNLIDNALKYSRHARPPRLSIQAERLEACCRIRVADNGIGFDMKYHDRIFGLFNRLVRTSEFEGTGAGLAIVAKLVDKLGGSVRAESSLGQGATFLIDLPLHAPRPSCAL